MKFFIFGNSLDNLFKILVITVSLLLGYEQYFQRIATINDTLLIAVYLLLFALLSSALYVSAFIINPALRFGWAAILSISCITHEAIIKTMGEALTYDTLILLAKSIGFAHAALEQYAGVIITSLPTGLLLFVGISWPPSLSRILYTRRTAQFLSTVYPLLVMLAFSALLFARGGNGSNGLPAAYIPLSLSSLYAYDILSEQRGERLEVSLKRQATTLSDKIDIIYIIDESIRGDYLDINHPNGAKSNLGKNPIHGKIYNFGLAASATNCSIGSNLTLRFGGTRKDYPRFINVMPSVWQYAKAAGYSTIYMDAQSEGKLYNGMDEAEIAQIDQLIQFKDVAPRDHDLAAARLLVKLINDDQRQFILINKLGAHFPIHDKYPDKFLVYQPALPRGEFVGAPPIVKTIFGSAETDWTKYKNSYKNTLLWVIGEFFGTIFNLADLNKAIILYTSDHGQNFHERNNPGVATHCAHDAAIEEGLVPMVAITGDTPPRDFGFAAAKVNINKTSHYNIFPTILNLLGYDPEAVKRIYGTSLIENVGDPFTFNTRFEARLGQPPIWEKINLDQVFYPTH